MDKGTRQKLAYARQQLKAGVRKTSDLQAAIKKKFGSGVRFIDLGTIYPKKKRRRKTAPSTRGRRMTATRDPFALVAGDALEVFPTRAAMARRAAELLAAGYEADEIAAYERTAVEVKVTRSVAV